MPVWPEYSSSPWSPWGNEQISFDSDMCAHITKYGYLVATRVDGASKKGVKKQRFQNLSLEVLNTLHKYFSK